VSHIATTLLQALLATTDDPGIRDLTPDPERLLEELDGASGLGEMFLDPPFQRGRVADVHDDVVRVTQLVGPGSSRSCLASTSTNACQAAETIVVPLLQHAHP
jgi:hypothetical protein